MKSVRPLLPLLLMSAVVLVFPSMASAAKPQRVPPPAELADFTVPAGTWCPFEVRYQELVNNEVTTLISDTERRVNGAYKARLTNTETGASIDVNASGPQFFRDAGGVETAVLPGPQIFLLSDVDAGGPGAFLIRGRTIMTRDLNTGAITQLHSKGKVTDLCAAIA